MLMLVAAVIITILNTSLIEYYYKKQLLKKGLAKLYQDYEIQYPITTKGRKKMSRAKRKLSKIK